MSKLTFCEGEWDIELRECYEAKVLVTLYGNVTWINISSQQSGSII